MATNIRLRVILAILVLEEVSELGLFQIWRDPGLVLRAIGLFSP